MKIFSGTKRKRFKINHHNMSNAAGLMDRLPKILPVNNSFLREIRFKSKRKREDMTFLGMVFPSALVKFKTCEFVRG